MRFIGNVVIRAAWLYVFSVLGWMSLQWGGQRVDSWQITWQSAVFLLAFSLAVSLVIKFVFLVLFIPIAFGSLLTLGCLIPFIGAILFSATFWVLSLVFPDVISFHGFWWTILCGGLIGLFNFDSIYSDKSDT